MKTKKIYGLNVKSEMKQKDNKIKVILVLCHQRSGSTILDLVMDSHSQIVGTGELFQYYKILQLDRYCTCGKKVKDCEKWNYVFKDNKKENLRVGRKFINLIFNKNGYRNKKGIIDYEQYLKDSENIYKKISEVFNVKIIFDTSKQLDRAELIARSDKMEVIFLHLVRDGRGVTWSCYKRYGKYLKYMFEWLKTNLKIEIIKRRNPEIKNIYINYSNLTKNPKRSLKKILNFANCDFEPEMLDFTKKVHHEIGGNLNTKYGKREKIIEDVEWKKKMPLAIKIFFNIFFGWINFYYLNKKE